METRHLHLIPFSTLYSSKRKKNHQQQKQKQKQTESVLNVTMATLIQGGDSRGYQGYIYIYIYIYILLVQSTHTQHTCTHIQHTRAHTHTHTMHPHTHRLYVFWHQGPASPTLKRVAALWETLRKPPASPSCKGLNRTSRDSSCLSQLNLSPPRNDYVNWWQTMAEMVGEVALSGENSRMSCHSIAQG